MLFLTPDNEFAGDKQEIPLEEIKAVRNYVIKQAVPGELAVLAV